MASETNSTVPTSISLYDSQNKAPRFAVCELLDAIESSDADEFDSVDWQDYLSQYADTGVRP